MYEGLNQSNQQSNQYHCKLLKWPVNVKASTAKLDKYNRAIHWFRRKVDIWLQHQNQYTPPFSVVLCCAVCPEDFHVLQNLTKTLPSSVVSHCTLAFVPYFKSVEPWSRSFSPSGYGKQINTFPFDWQPPDPHADTGGSVSIEFHHRCVYRVCVQSIKNPNLIRLTALSRKRNICPDGTWWTVVTRLQLQFQKYRDTLLRRLSHAGQLHGMSERLTIINI